MTADEYETSLQVNVEERFEWAERHRDHGPHMSCCREKDRALLPIAALDDLLAFVRLRAVAGEPCYQFEAFSRRDCRQMDTLRRHDGTVKLCGPCSAQREMDKLLVAEVPKRAGCRSEAAELVN